MNAKLARMFGTPLNLTEGHHTRAKSDHADGSKAASIMANPWTRSSRCGYGVGGHGSNAPMRNRKY